MGRHLFSQSRRPAKLELCQLPGSVVRPTAKVTNKKKGRTTTSQRELSVCATQIHGGAGRTDGAPEYGASAMACTAGALFSDGLRLRRRTAADTADFSVVLSA